MSQTPQIPLNQSAMRHVVIILATLCLSGCGALLSPGPPPSRLQLSPPMPGKAVEAPLNRQLIVATPVAGRDIDSDSIALVFNGREVRILADARWAGTVPQMIQRNVITAFEEAGVLRGVGDESAGMAADARLLSDIRQFSLHYAEEGGVPTAVFEGTFRLLSLSSGKIIGTHTVSVRTLAGGKDKAALVRAMETALGRGLAEIVPWATEKMRQLR